MPRHNQAKDNVSNRIALAPEFQNPAVARCCKAWNRSFNANLKAGTDPVLVYVRANEAYRFAMPPLSNLQNLCDFVACVAHGLVLNTIPMPHAAAMMDAARVASHALKTAAPADSSAAPGVERKKRKNKISGDKTANRCLKTTTYLKKTLENVPELDRKSA